MGKNSRKKIVKKNYGNGFTNKNTLVVGGILLIVLSYWGINQLGGSDYPKMVSGVFYDTPSVSTDSSKVIIPEDVLDYNKLVFVDVKLDNKTEEFTYLGRNIILSTYKNSEYLPLIILQTPKGKTVGGIRVCEPCSSFNFHIVDRKYLQCDTCGTRWDIETFKGLSGGCLNYPPPKLSTGLVDGIVVEVGQLGLGLQS